MAVASRGWLPSKIRKKPIACVYVFSPSFLTFLISWRLLNLPNSLRYKTICWATPAFKPDTYFKSDFEAVLISTPTLLTVFSTTKSSCSSKSFSGISCWYWPTEIAFGSILTSSAKGSCKRLAMETADLSSTW